MSKSAYLTMLSLMLIISGCDGNTERHAEKTVDLNILTHDYAPLNFSAEGEITGQATEIVRELVERTGTSASYQIVAWEDGLKAVMEQPHTALYSTAMNLERKAHLQWVGPVTVLDSNLYAREGSGITVRTLDDVKGITAIATVAEYYTEQYLKEEGFSNLKRHASEEEALRALLSGEADLFASNNTVMPALLEQVGATMDSIENVFTLSTDMTYIAFSPETPPALVARWQQQLDAMKRDGTFDRIYAQWLPIETPPGILQLVTEEYPPVTFMLDGEPSGFVTDMVREITTRLDIPDTIKLTTWKNAYNMALLHPNVVIFSMDRTAAREDLFHWVGPVGQNSAILFARKGSDLTIDSMADAKEVSAIATTTEWWTEQHLTREGFTNLHSSPEPTENVRQLMNGDVQLSIFTDITIPEIVRNAGYTMDDLEPVFTVEKNYFYVGISKGTPEEIVSQWQATLETMKEDGTFADIYHSYLPHAEIDMLLKQ